MKKITMCFSLFMLLGFASVDGQQNELGLFDEHGDVGGPIVKGNTVYNKHDQTYLLSGAGKNVWAKLDQFQFVWKKLKGDFIIKATAKFIGKGVDGHRKISVMARDKLTTDSRYIDGTFHGGLPQLTFLQYRA